METTKSLEIIESMLRESKKSLFRNSFYFLLWGILLIPISILDYFIGNQAYFWLVWPSIGIIGGFISYIYGKNESKNAGVISAGDRIIMFTWGAFGFSLVYVIVFSVMNQAHTG